jgi:hypothetical protein
VRKVKNREEGAMKKKICSLLLLLLLCGCAPADAVETAPTVSRTVPSETVPDAVQEEARALSAAPLPAAVVRKAEPSGEKQEKNDDAVIDYSHTEDGYIMARYTGQTDKRLKLRLTGPTTTYTYNLPLDQWTVFPLSDGSGSYQASLYINTTGSKYASVMSVQFEAQLRSEFEPFLRPNQYVDYAEAEVTVATAAELCAGLDHPLEKVAAVYDHVVTALEYDHEKAATVQSGYLPVLDEVLAQGKGICFDYAAVMTAMLRAQEVPCKLVVGYAGDIYHAWVSVWTEEHGWVDGAILFDGKVWKRMDPTFASSGQRSDEIMDFIENGNYTVKYLY